MPTADALAPGGEDAAETGTAEKSIADVTKMITSIEISLFILFYLLIL